MNLRIPIDYPTIADYAAKEEPEKWRAVYPRLYQGAEGYGNPKTFAMSAYDTMYGLNKLGPANVGSTTSMIALTCARMVEYKCPAFFVSNELAAAVLQSAPPSDMKWKNVPVPFSAACFYLPRNFIRYGDGYIEFIGYGNLERTN